jgi:hypothetical protein
LDRADALWNRYLNKHKKLKWTKAVAFCFIKMSLVNAWLSFKMCKGTNQSQRKFLEEIILNISLGIKLV